MNHPRWHKTFLGIRQQHCYGLYETIDRVLVDNPQICKFVEIGTGGGALSVVLALHAVQRDTFLITFDTQIRGDRLKADSAFAALGVRSYLYDCFDKVSVDIIDQYLEDSPCFFFCDGGNKLKELKMFAPLLSSQSIIAAHDYCTAALDKDQADKAARDLSLVPYLPEIWCGGVDDIRTCFYLVK